MRLQRRHLLSIVVIKRKVSLIKGALQVVVYASLRGSYSATNRKTGRLQHRLPIQVKLLAVSHRVVCLRLQLHQLRCKTSRPIACHKSRRSHQDRWRAMHLSSDRLKTRVFWLHLQQARRNWRSDLCFPTKKPQASNHPL